MHRTIGSALLFILLFSCSSEIRVLPPQEEGKISISVPGNLGGDGVLILTMEDSTAVEKSFQNGVASILTFEKPRVKVSFLTLVVAREEVVYEFLFILPGDEGRIFISMDNGIPILSLQDGRKEFVSSMRRKNK